MLSLSSPGASVPGQVDPASPPNALLDVPELDADEPCPAIDPALLENVLLDVPELDAGEPCPAIDPALLEAGAPPSAPDPEARPEPELLVCPWPDSEL
ncbi:MAG: hypothetical protein FWD17_18910 [Polyangiaceae bacterium]|nr:hypothetical protein [Polyangiaceae bacterium]